MSSNFNFEKLRQITLFIGAYGSGKSEISANFAVWLARCGKPVTLCDMDMINPYFRTADARARLEPLGVKVISPRFAGSNVDVPALPSAVHSVFSSHCHAVLDIGGEDLGARVVASLAPQLEGSDRAIYMVINALRPPTSSLEKILQQAKKLQQATGFPIDGIVQNTNLLEESDAALLQASDALIEQAASTLKVPVVFAAALPQAVSSASKADRPLLVLERFIKYPHQTVNELA